MMALSNKIENGIIAAITMIITVIIFGLYTQFFVLKPILSELSETRKIVEKVAMKDTYSISNDFDKMRTKQGSSIILDLNNELNHFELMPVDTVTVDTVQKKSGWKIWRKIFGDKK